MITPNQAMLLFGMIQRNKIHQSYGLTIYYKEPES